MSDHRLGIVGLRSGGAGRCDRARSLPGICFLNLYLSLCLRWREGPGVEGHLVKHLAAEAACRAAPKQILIARIMGGSVLFRRLCRSNWGGGLIADQV